MTNKKIEYTHFPCPVCNCKTYKVLYPDTLHNQSPCVDYKFSSKHNKTYRVVVCNNCKHTYCSPRPKNLWQNYTDTKDEKYLEQKKQRIATAYKLIKTMRKYMPQGKLLDIGCSTGDFLVIAKKYYEVEGLELSDWAVDIARKNGLLINKSKLESFKPESNFDIVTMWGVIEHFEFPSKELENINKLLKKDGFVFLWTGDQRSWLPRLLGKNWWYFQGQHIQIYNYNSLIKLFHNNGFQKVWVGRYPYVMTMHSLSNSLMRYPLIGKILKPILTLQLVRNLEITLRLSGELFGIFKKMR